METLEPDKKAVRLTQQVDYLRGKDREEEQRFRPRQRKNKEHALIKQSLKVKRTAGRP